MQYETYSSEQHPPFHEPVEAGLTSQDPRIELRQRIRIRDHIGGNVSAITCPSAFLFGCQTRGT